VSLKHISRRRFLTGTLGFTAASMALPSSAKGRPKSAAPNFVFILSDDQGWNCTSVPMRSDRDDAKSDYFLTPNLARLAGQGIRFSQGYSPAALCCPTRRSLQFGQTPARQGSQRFATDYPPGGTCLSIPRLLKAVDPGYAAAHFGKWDHRTDLLPEHVGYDESDGNTGNREGNKGSEFDKQGKWALHKELDDPKRIFSVTDRANDFMARQVHAGRPFYVQISHYAVHVDMQTRPETLRKHEQRPKGTVHRIPAFAGMTEDLDTGIGKVLDKLDELGIADSTYVFYLADNGAVPWIPPDPEKHLANPTSLDDVSRNHPLRSGKWTLFEGGIRVPFIVRGPAVKPGTFCDVPAVGWDILPTIADLAGYQETLPKDIDGGSLRPLLENGGVGAVKRPFEGLVFHRYSEKDPHSAIRVGDYKLILFWKRTFQAGRFRVNASREPEKLLLFNLRDDIGETNNLADAMPEKAQELREKLMAYLRAVGSDVLELSE